MLFLKTLTAILTLPALILADTPSINLPLNGTHVAPGANSTFDYTIGTDYCASSFGFRVFIFTKKPNGFKQGETWETGTFLGKFEEESEPDNLDPKHPPPPTLTMPNFRRSPGGFGRGAYTHDLPVYLTVLEEISTCDAALGV